MSCSSVLRPYTSTNNANRSSSSVAKEYSRNIFSASFTPREYDSISNQLYSERVWLYNQPASRTCWKHNILMKASKHIDPDNSCANIKRHGGEPRATTAPTTDTYMRLLRMALSTCAYCWGEWGDPEPLCTLLLPTGIGLTLEDFILVISTVTPEGVFGRSSGCCGSVLLSATIRSGNTPPFATSNYHQIRGNRVSI